MSKNTIKIGDQVDVAYHPGELYNHDFVGKVVDIEHGHIVVVDQDDNCWAVPHAFVSLANED